MRNFHQPPSIDDSCFEGSSPKDKILTLLNYAVLAPSTHNTQPWKFKLTDAGCEILNDQSRQLPAADPLRRDMYISLGAMLKNLELAAEAFGVLDNIEWSDQETPLVATVQFKDLEKKNNIKASLKDILKAITTRTNYRGPFKTTPLSTQTKRVLKDTGSNVKLHLVEDQSTIEAIADVTASGLKMAYARPQFRQEIASWIKPNTSRQKTGIPGYSLRMPLITSHIIPKIMKRKDIGPKLSQLNYKSFVTAPAVVVLSTKEEKPLAWLKVGGAAQEIFLRMEMAGLVCSIFVAAIETDELRPKLKKLAGIKSGQPQFLFCIGKPVLPKVYSPRESVTSKLIS